MIGVSPSAGTQRSPPGIPCAETMWRQLSLQVAGCCDGVRSGFCEPTVCQCG
ncbi:MAG: hypothetical protein IJW39_01850 [Opitutales bacterium]|nr:hypothetical protein [Opitutales bacterium]